MRRASAQAWLASARTPISQIGARSSVLCTRNHSSLQAARQLSSSPHTPSTRATASSTLRRLGLAAVQPLRAGTRRTWAGRRYSSQATESSSPTLGKVATETPEALEALRADFYQWQRKTLNWNIGIPLPRAVLWLVFFQFLGLAPYSYYTFAHDDPIRILQEHVETVKRMTTPRGAETAGEEELKHPGFRVKLAEWERTALHTAVSLGVLSAIAFFWARRRTKRSFNSFILSRALGETTGNYPIGLENVTRHGDSIKVKGHNLKIIRNQIVRLAGLKAVQASAVLLLSSSLSTYALTHWLNAKARDEVVRFRRSDVAQGETVLSAMLLLNFILSWAVLAYQPYTIFPFVASTLLAPWLPIPSGYDFQKLSFPYKTTVTEYTKVTDVEGGKEYVTVKETKTGSNLSRTETRVFVPDDAPERLRQVLEVYPRNDSKKERDGTAEA